MHMACPSDDEAHTLHYRWYESLSGLLAVQNVCCEHEFEDWHCWSAQCWQGMSQKDVIARSLGLLALWNMDDLPVA